MSVTIHLSLVEMGLGKSLSIESNLSRLGIMLKGPLDFGLEVREIHFNWNVVDIWLEPVPKILGKDCRLEDERAREEKGDKAP